MFFTLLINYKRNFQIILKALKSGIKPNKIVFSGVGKTEEELRLAIKKKVLLIALQPAYCAALGVSSIYNCLVGKTTKYY